MKSQSSRGGGYLALAAAIVNSGVATNDEAFLKSDWCKYLTDTVVELSNVQSGTTGTGIHNAGFSTVISNKSGRGGSDD